MNLALRGLVVLASLFFLFAGSVKVTGLPASMFEHQMTEYLLEYGMNRQIAFLIGLAELFGAVTIWFHRSRWIGIVGAGTLVVVTAGALFFHLTFDTFRDGILALVMLILSASILSGSLYLRARTDS